jgi:hypothetical protein
VETGREKRSKVEFARGLAVATLAAIAAAALSSAAPAAAASHPTLDAASLYRDALGTTRSWSVHYVSRSTQSQVTLDETGDAGPASGTQTVLTGKGSLEDTITIYVIGGITYVKGNVGGLEILAGLNAAQAAEASNRWIDFSTSSSAFSQVVSGVRSHDVATELELKGPLTLRHSRSLDGVTVDAIEGTQVGPSNKTQHVVLYVRAGGRHVPVEEDSVDAHGKSTSALHVVYSHWGEPVRPEAPSGALALGPVSAV